MATTPSILARPFFLAQDATHGKMIPMNVLEHVQSQEAIDPKSLKLGSLVDAGGATNAKLGLTRKDGRVLNVPGEGTWLVDDGNNIVFQAEQGLDHPPTPVSYYFSDVKGNRSVPAMIVIDPGLADVPKYLGALSDQTDAQFWAALKQHAGVDPEPPLELDVFLSIAHNLMLATQFLVPDETLNPIAKAHYEAAYKEWNGVNYGQSNDGLCDICEALGAKVANINPAPLAARYWGLVAMVRMLLQAQKEQS